jgi:tetratricopeptide (TPR) repeat protein
LVSTGLATQDAYNHISLSPALGPYLKATLSAEEQDELIDRWVQAMLGYLEALYNLSKQAEVEAQTASVLTLLELPNLLLLLDRMHARGHQTIDGARLLFKLINHLGKPRLLARLEQFIVEEPVPFNGWSKLRFNALYGSIEHQISSMRGRDALQNAESLLIQAQAAGEYAYEGANFDIATAFFMLGRVLRMNGYVIKAAPLHQEACRRFNIIAVEESSPKAERMVYSCITEIADCATEHGDLEYASVCYNESIRRAIKADSLRDIAVAKGQLATLRIMQSRFDEALVLINESRDIFLRLNETGSIGVVYDQIGLLRFKMGQPEAAEEAFIESLRYRMQNDDLIGQACTHYSLGQLYEIYQDKPQEAVTCFRQALEICSKYGQIKMEWKSADRLANMLCKLNHLDEARHIIRRSIACKLALGHEAQPWRSWEILCNIEIQAGNTVGAKEASLKALSAYIDYRRDGGSDFGQIGQLALAIHQDLVSGFTANAVSLLDTLEPLADWVHDLAYLGVLKKIVAGSRDTALAQDPSLNYFQAAEILLLIEALDEQKRNA